MPKWHRGPKVDIKKVLEFEVWGAEQDLIIYLQQLVLSNVSTEGWIIKLYVYGLFDGSGEVV